MTSRWLGPWRITTLHGVSVWGRPIMRPVGEDFVFGPRVPDRERFSHPGAVGEWPCVLVWRATDPIPPVVPTGGGWIAAPPLLRDGELCWDKKCGEPAVGRCYIPTVTPWKVFVEEWRPACETHLQKAAAGDYYVPDLREDLHWAAFGNHPAIDNEDPA